MRSFPPTWKFKKLNKKKKYAKVLSIDRIIELSTSINDCLDSIKNISNRDINTIERRSRGQSKCDEWFHYRRSCVTGTITHRISNSIKKGEKGLSENLKAATSKSRHFPLYYPAIVWGRENEEMGIAAFIKKMKPKHHNLQVKSRGLQLDDTHHYIAASIDGLVECFCCEPAILEIKCPYSIRDGSVARDGRKLAYLTDELELKKSHTYYYQLQTYLGVYKLKTGYFCVYTPQDVLILTITFDEYFWKNLKNDICTYYKHHYLNDLFS